jgi:hypothetical protein
LAELSALLLAGKTAALLVARWADDLAAKMVEQWEQLSAGKRAGQSDN